MTKIVCSKSPHLPYSTMQGWADAMSDQFIFWDYKNKPVFDIFDEVEPDIFISTVEDISRGVVMCLKEYTDTISLFYSPTFSKVSKEDLEYMHDLKEETGKPDFIFNFCHESRLDETLGGWSEKGYKTLSVVKAANTKIFKPSPVERQWQSDISIVEDYTPELAAFVLPLCNTHQVRIFGDGWPIPQGVGRPSYTNLSKVYSSSNIVLDISYEVSDTAFNVFAAGGFCISNTAQEIIPDLPHFNTPEELQTLIKHYHEKPKGRESLINKYREHIITNHTYEKRIQSLFESMK